MVTFTLEAVDDDDVEWDLQQSFEAMDDEKLGRLSIHAAYTLLLGLGYLNLRDRGCRFTEDDLRCATRALRRRGKVAREFANDDGEWVTMDILKEVLRMYDAALQRDRSAWVFQSTVKELDQGKKGFLDASDIQELAADVGDPIVREEAEAIVAVTRNVVEGDDMGESKIVSYGEVQQLLSRPADAPDGIL